MTTDTMITGATAAYNCSAKKTKTKEKTPEEDREDTQLANGGDA